MTTATPTLSQLKSQAAAIRQKIPQARIIGIQSRGRWTGPEEARDGDRAYVIRQCDSPLAMRQALRRIPAEQETMVLVTPLDDTELSDDILVRLTKRKLFHIDAWQIVRSLFQAHAVDPRLTGNTWIAEALLDARPADGYPAARGGFLDAETVWHLLLSRTIGLTAELPDFTELLRWSLNAAAVRRFRGAPDEFREAAIQWLTGQAGTVAGLLLSCVERWEHADGVPLGLAAVVVFHPSATGKLEKALGKLEERFLSGRAPDPDLMRRWAAAATEVVRALRHTDARLYRQALQRADDILGELGADGFAHLSDTSPSGFDRRLARFGSRLDGIVSTKSWQQAGELTGERDAVRAHDQSSREVRRLERVEMAVRLVRWLAARDAVPAEPRSFGEAADGHLREGGFVDWARLALRAGDQVRELSAAYARLFEAVSGVREQQARGFAGLLADWTAAGSPPGDMVTVEQILEQVVAPLMADRPVLLIVLDGMSVAVSRELLSDLARHEWISICEPGRTRNRPGVAVIPSATEFSRTSLLCGELRRGAAGDEQSGFANHPALLAHCRSNAPPVLFHKVALQEAQDAVLAREVRDAIQSSHRRIVGVVINAIDDHLLKGDQLDLHWSRDEIKVLPVLLHEAKFAGRLVVLTSDHGHVLDVHAQARPAEGGERWRNATNEPAADELLVQGPRVLAAGQRVIAPWSERVRYGIKKNGYHGGLNPQEMIVPIIVLTASTADLPAGWTEQPIDTPAWWDEPADSLGGEPQPAPQLKPVKPKPSGKLFELDAEDSIPRAQPPAAPAAQRTTAAWVARLLACPVFAEQKRLGGRGLPSDEVFERLLALLDQHGGKLTSVALARGLQFPPMRLPGLLAKAERVLNVDGYDILRRDDVANTVELNRELLLKQFDLVE